MLFLSINQYKYICACTYNIIYVSENKNNKTIYYPYNRKRERTVKGGAEGDAVF